MHGDEEGMTLFDIVPRHRPVALFQSRQIYGLDSEGWFRTFFRYGVLRPARTLAFAGTSDDCTLPLGRILRWSSAVRVLSVNHSRLPTTHIEEQATSPRFRLA
jgi:hypothetical protein